MKAWNTIAGQPKIAFVQDVLLAPGGAEKLLASACETFPQADLYTLIYRPGAFSGWPFVNRRVRVSFLDRLPMIRKRHRMFFPLMPLAVESFDLSPYDIIVSFSYAVAHGVRAPSGTRHLAYFHTPMRYAWRVEHPTVSRLNQRFPPAAWAARRFLQAFRRWDCAVAARPQELAAVSNWVAGCIGQAYGRIARVIYPPVEVDAFRPLRPRQPYYVSLSRLVHHKRLDLIIQAFHHLRLPLLVIGEGPEERRLRAMAGPGVQFLGWQPQARVAELLGRARAFVHAGQEDFGIAMAEAQAAGCPVIAPGCGAAPEIVLDGLTGLLYPEQSVDSLASAVVEMERRPERFDPFLIQASARRFDRRRFQRELSHFVLRIEAPEGDDELLAGRLFENALVRVAQAR